MFTIIGAMAELERNIIRERVLAGMEHARRHGTRSGKPVGRPIAIFDRAQALQFRSQGLSWRELSRKLRVGASTIRRFCKHAEPGSASAPSEPAKPPEPSNEKKEPNREKGKNDVDDNREP